MKRFLALTAALMCWGCTNTQPVVLIGQYGQILRGSTTTSFSVITVTLSDGAVNCAAKRDGMDTTAPEITMALLCSDGRRGIATIQRQDGAASGGGSVRFTDGTLATFIYGPDAKKF
jgi:hypothetical protein